MKMMLRKLKLRFGLIFFIFLEFTGLPSGVNRSAASDINADSSPFSIFILFFRQVFQFILTETNRYFPQYMSSRTTGSTSTQPPDTTTQEIYTFFGLMIQMGNDTRHSLKDYWSREEQYCIHGPHYISAGNVTWSLRSGLL